MKCPPVARLQEASVDLQAGAGYAALLLTAQHAVPSGVTSQASVAASCPTWQRCVGRCHHGHRRHRSTRPSPRGKRLYQGDLQWQPCAAASSRLQAPKAFDERSPLCASMRQIAAIMSFSCLHDGSNEVNPTSHHPRPIPPSCTLTTPLGVSCPAWSRQPVLLSNVAICCWLETLRFQNGAVSACTFFQLQACKAFHQQGHPTAHFPAQYRHDIAVIMHFWC